VFHTSKGADRAHRIHPQEGPHEVEVHPPQPDLPEATMEIFLATFSEEHFGQRIMSLELNDTSFSKSVPQALH